MKNYRSYLDNIPEGYHVGTYKISTDSEGKKYGISKKSFNDGLSTKLFAEELGGNDFVSFNVYKTKGGDQIKPCEMPLEKVLDFIENVDITSK